MAEQSINCLGSIVRKCMKESNVTLNECNWRMKLCKESHNVLGIMKLGWRSPKEVLRGDKPGVPMFKFYIWEPALCLGPDDKQPRENLFPEKFLGMS